MKAKSKIISIHVYVLFLKIGNIHNEITLSILTHRYTYTNKPALGGESTCVVVVVVVDISEDAMMGGFVVVPRDDSVEMSTDVVKVVSAFMELVTAGFAVELSVGFCCSKNVNVILSLITDLEVVSTKQVNFDPFKSDRYKNTSLH